MEVRYTTAMFHFLRVSSTQEDLDAEGCRDFGFMLAQDKMHGRSAPASRCGRFR